MDESNTREIPPDAPEPEVGADPDAAYRDCLPFQYVLRARPLEQDA